MSLNPIYLNFAGLIEQRLFRVPNYQRHYSWEKSQRDDLFNDIRTVARKLENTNIDYEHYMATIVLLQKEQIDGTVKMFRKYDVVDGQQRITTLIILAKAIAMRLDLENQDEAMLQEEINRLLTNGNRSELVLLQTNHDNSNILTQYLLTGKKPGKSHIRTLADKNINDAFKQCEDFCRSWLEHNRTLVFLYRILFNRLTFVLQTLTDERIVYTTFEVLNSRGLDVDWLDKTKSTLMGLVYEADTDNALENIDQIKSIWEQIYRTIGIRDISGSEILKYSATLHRAQEGGEILSEKLSLNHFRNYCQEENENIIERVREVSAWLSYIATELSGFYKDTLRPLTGVSHARLFNLSLRIRAKKIRDADLKSKIFKQWEITTFRIFSLFGETAKKHESDYVRLAHKIYHNKIKDGEITSLIKTISEEYSPKEGAIEFAKSIVRAKNYREYNDELKYLFFEYEKRVSNNSENRQVWNEILSKKLDDSIEHILPKTPNLPPHWCQFKKPENYFSRLGNLLLLPVNINAQAGTKSFADKKLIYINTNITMVRAIAQDYEEWDINTLKKREEELKEFIVSRWCDLDD